MEKAQMKLETGQERGFEGDEEKEFDGYTAERKAILKEIEKEKKFEEVRNQKILADAKNDPGFAIGGKEDKEYSQAKAFRAAATRNWNEAGLEKELHQEWSRGHNKAWSENMMYVDPNQRASSIVGTPADGGNLVGTQYRGDKLIDVLWNASVLSKLPVVNNTGLVGFQSVPVKTSKTTATMVGEIAALPAAEKVTVGILTATPKEMVTKGAFSRQLAIQSDPMIDKILEREVYKAIAEKLDDMFINGSGVSPLLQGILSLAGIDTVSNNAAGAALTYQNLVKMYTNLGKSNVDVSGLSFLTNMQVIGTAMTTLKDTANTASGYILSDMMKNLLNIPTVVSQSIPSNLQTSTTRSAIILGNFSETEVFQWDKIAIEFDNISAADNSQIVIRSYSFWDFMHKRAANYSVIKDAITI